MAKDNNHWDDIKKKGAKVASAVKEKGAEVAGNLQKHPAVKEATAAAKKNPKEAILGTLIALGFIFSFYWVGSLIVGLAAALFIPWSIKEVWERAFRFYEEEGKFASFMLAVAVLFLLVHTFWFVIGLAAGLAVKLLLPKRASSGK